MRQTSKPIEQSTIKFEIPDSGAASSTIEESNVMATSPPLLTFAGEFSKPSNNKFQKLEKLKTLYFEHSRGLNSLIYLEKLDKLIICDKTKCELKIILSFGNFKYQPEIHVFKHEYIKKPRELCLGNNNDIFISEHLNDDRILVFDVNLHYIRQIRMKSMFVDKMKIDLSDNQYLLYISDWSDNKIIVRFSENGRFKCVINITGPTYVEFDSYFLYVTSFPIFSRNRATDIVEGVQKNSNCIFILNKSNYDVVKKISFDNWLGPEGLYLNNDFNIFTTASKFNRDKKESSDFFYLYEVTLDGSVVRKFKFEDNSDEETRYTYICDRYVFVCYETHLNIYRYC